MILMQVSLKNKNTRMMTWIPKHPKVKRGSMLTLKEIPDIVWEVDDIYSTIDSDCLHTDWNVGGLTDTVRSQR